VLFSDGAVHISVESLSTEWTMKSVCQWASDDVLYWIISVAQEKGLNAEEIDMKRFSGIDGTALYKMSEADFVSRESQYGKFLYPLLQQLKQEQDQQMAYGLNKREFFFVKVVCMFSTKQQNGFGCKWYAVILMLLDRFNFRCQFLLQTLLKDKQHFTFLRTGMQQANT
jgi:hypothetical protein